MPMDYKRLATFVREAREARGWRQEDLAAAAHIGLSSVQNVEAGRPFTRIPASLRKIDAALGWEEGSCHAVLRGDEPTPRRETSENSVASGDADAFASARRPMPVPVQLALEEGELLDYDVVTFEVDGEPVTMVALAKTGVASNEQKREVLRKQLEVFGRIKGHIQAEAEATRATPDED